MGVPRYRRRRPIPALILLVVLGVVATFVWTKVFGTSGDAEAAVRCDPPPPAQAGAAPPKNPAGEAQPRDALDKAEPIPAAGIKVTVFNGGGQRRQGQLVNDELHQLGFDKGGEPADDPLYPSPKLTCFGQIRYGVNGAQAARTLSLVVPCAQLVRDARQDATVDLAVGKKLGGIKPSTETKQVLEKLREWAEKQPAARAGGQQAAPAAPPQLDPAALIAARAIAC